ncbi:MAG TPA: hypothetical protein VGG99_21005 [Acetobacteraceae bacterium]
MPFAAMVPAAPTDGKNAPMSDHKQHDHDEPRDTRTAALIGLIVILVLAIGSIMLVRALRTESQREDCLMAGRRNCAPIDVPARQ